MEIVHTAEFASRAGRMRIASTERGLAYLALPHASGRGLAGWQQRFAPGARLCESRAANRTAIEQTLAFLDGERSEFELPLDLRGTDFQLKVYAALCEIPYGQTRSYAEIAARIGRPRAVRAVGTANGANPIPLVVPCHRVINAGGGLGGYGGGLDLKRRLLAMERVRVHPGDML